MAIYLSNRDGHGVDPSLTNEEGHFRFQTKAWAGDVLRNSGGELAVTQSSPLSLGVLISTGDFKIDTTGYSYTGWVGANEPITLTTANPSNPRIDAIVLYVDKDEDTTNTSNNPGIVKAAAVAGTPSGSPVAPDDAAIKAAIGASNPYIRLANVIVNAGVTQVTNGNITDTRVFVTAHANSVNTTAIANGTVTPEKLLAGTGSSWVWQSWTPTWTNVTIGNATVNAKYIQIGKTVHCTILMTAGSTTSFSASVFRITLPIPAESRYVATVTRAPIIGVVYYEDAGVAGYQGMIQGVSTTTVQFVVPNVSSTYPANVAVSSTIPFTWGNGDYIGGSFTYEAA